MCAFYMGSLPEESKFSSSESAKLHLEGPRKRRPSSVASELNLTDPDIKQAVSNLHHHKNATWMASMVLKTYIEFKRTLYESLGTESDPRLETIEEAVENNQKSVHIDDLLRYMEFLQTFTEEDIPLKKLKDFVIKAVNYAHTKRVVSKKSSASSQRRREERESVIGSVTDAADELLETAKSVYDFKIPKGYDRRAIGNVKRIAEICKQNETLVHDATKKRGGARSYRSRPVGTRRAITKRRSRI